MKIKVHSIALTHSEKFNAESYPNSGFYLVENTETAGNMPELFFVNKEQNSSYVLLTVGPAEKSIFEKLAEELAAEEEKAGKEIYHHAHEIGENAGVAIGYEKAKEEDRLNAPACPSGISETTLLKALAMAHGAKVDNIKID